LSKDSNIKFLTDSLRSCKYRNWYVIDQIVVSNATKQRVVENSARLYDLFGTIPKKELKTISDHCPVLVDIDIREKDNDDGDFGDN
jgi:hypothetical protein